MALTKENLSQLLALQEQDAALDKLKADMAKLPVEVARLKAELAAEKGRAAEAKAKTVTLEKKKKDRELELAQREEAVKKHSLDLNSVKTNEAFKALQHEIDGAKAQANAIETQILEVMEEIDASRSEEKALAAELGVLEKKALAEIAVVEARLAEVQARFDGSKAARDQSAAPVPAEAMKIYDHVRSRGKLDAVVPISGDACSACRMTLAPQIVVEATKAKSLVCCESCQRIIYRRESLAAKAA